MSVWRLQIVVFGGYALVAGGLIGAELLHRAFGFLVIFGVLVVDMTAFMQGRSCQ